MLHAKIEAEGPQIVCVSTLQKELALLAAGLDKCFIRAGTTLASAIETIDRVIAALDSVWSVLDERTAGQAVLSLQQVAARLAELPAIQTAQEADMNGIATASHSLRDHVIEMHETLRVLRIYGLNIKIAASGTDEFVAFVDGMSTRLGIGERHIAAFLAKLKELTASVGSVQQAARLLGAECQRVVPQVPQRLASDADDLRKHLTSVASVAQRVSGIARDIQGKVATILGALQVGDSTRQRLEHVVAALQLLDSRQSEADEDAATGSAVTMYVHRLLAALLEATASDFDRGAVALVDSLKGLSPDTVALLSLIENDTVGNGRPFLIRLEHGITEIERVTSQLRDADARSRTMVGIIAETVDELTERLENIGRVQLDVQDIAINTRLLCRRYGNIGKAVSVIATEIDLYADKLGSAMKGVALPIRQLGTINLALANPHGAQGEQDIGRKLAEALAVIRNGCHETERAASEGGDDARQLVDLLDTVGDEVAAELAIGDTMRAAAATLSIADGIEPLPDAADAILRDLLPKISALYTMAQEREVHARFLLPGMETTVTTAADQDDDEEDDGLF